MGYWWGGDGCRGGGWKKAEAWEDAEDEAPPQKRVAGAGAARGLLELGRVLPQELEGVFDEVPGDAGW